MITKPIIISLAIISLVASLYIQYIIYRPRIYVELGITHATPPYGGLLLKGVLLEKVLKDYNISISNITLPYKYIYFIVLLDNIGLYIDGKIYLKDNVSNWDALLEKYTYTCNIDMEKCALVHKPVFNKLIIIGSNVRLNISSDPQTYARPRVMLYIDGELYDNFSFVYSVPLWIMDLGYNTDEITFFISIEKRNTTYTRETVYNIILNTVKNSEEIASKYKNTPWIFAQVEREPARLIYINNWPAILLPEHDICNVLPEEVQGNIQAEIAESIAQFCIKHPTIVASGIKQEWISIQTYLGNEKAIEQLNIFLDTLAK